MLSTPKLRKHFLHQIRAGSRQQPRNAIDVAIFVMRTHINRFWPVKLIEFHAVGGVQLPTQLVDEHLTAVVPHLLKELGWQLLPGACAELQHFLHPLACV